MSKTNSAMFLKCLEEIFREWDDELLYGNCVTAFGVGVGSDHEDSFSRSMCNVRMDNNY